jgi:hypothetical protein
MRNAHCRIWNMVRILKNVENETKKSVSPGIWKEILKHVKNEKCTLYVEKTENHG